MQVAAIQEIAKNLDDAHNGSVKKAANEAANEAANTRLAFIADSSTANQITTLSRLKVAAMIDGCLCCTGKVTLQTKLLAVLREQRRRSQYQAVVMLLNRDANLLQLMDHLLQPFFTLNLSLCAVIEINSETNDWRHAITHRWNATAGLISNSGNLPVAPRSLFNPIEFGWINAGTFKWPATTQFSRGQIAQLLLEPLGLGDLEIEFHARTQREWYCWTFDTRGWIQTISGHRHCSLLQIKALGVLNEQQHHLLNVLHTRLEACIIP